MPQFRLSEQQINFFHMFGYLHLPGLFKDRVEHISRSFEEVWKRRGHTHGGQTRSALVPFIDRHEGLLEIIDDDRFDGVASSLLGDDFNFIGSDGNYYVGDTPWHCDSWHEDKVFMKMAFYLDPITRDTGALRIVPGSHILESYRCKLGTAIQHSAEEFGLHGRDIPAVALESQPGDLVCFHHNCLHASFGGSKARRMFTVDVCQHYEPERIKELQDYMAIFANKGLPRIWSPRMYEKAGPRRMKHLEQVLNHDSHMKAIAEKAAAEGRAAYSLA